MVYNGLYMVYVYIYWLVVEPTPLKNMSSSVGMMTFPTEWEKIMFQTTNQIRLVNGKSGSPYYSTA